MIRLPMSIALASVLAAGCAKKSNLEPATAVGPTENVKNAAFAQSSGVKMTVSPDGWPGLAVVRNHLVPMKVEIQNDSNRPLAIRYQDFALIAPDGDQHIAMPPVTTVGTRSYPVENAFEYVPVTTPEFTATNFYVAPWLSALYPTLEPYGERLTANTGLGSSFYENFAPFNIPTQPMLSRVVPEGVLMPGGKVTGWLYFEKIGDTDRVRFRAELVNPNTSRQFGEITIPFVNDAG